MKIYSWQHAIRDSELASTTKLVLYTIGTHAAQDGRGCFPSYNTLAKESGLGRRTVIDHVEKARDAGFLVIQSRERSNGSASSNIYYPAMPHFVQYSPEGGATDAPPSAGDAPAGGATDAPHINRPIINRTSNINICSRFDEFWEVFKDKRGKQAAQRVWNRKKLDNIADEVIAGAHRYIKARGANKKYWKQAQGWLNDGRWEDDNQDYSHPLDVAENMPFGG